MISRREKAAGAACLSPCHFAQVLLAALLAPVSPSPPGCGSWDGIASRNSAWLCTSQQSRDNGAAAEQPWGCGTPQVSGSDAGQPECRDSCWTAGHRSLDLC